MDIGPDQRWVGVPFALPVAVYLPIWPRELATISSAPMANCLMRCAEAAIRPKMRCPCDGTGGRRGTDDLPFLDKRPMNLDPGFQANAAVPIDGDVAAGRRLLCLHCVPDQPTALRHQARKLGRVRPAPDDSEGHARELVGLDRRGRHVDLSAADGRFDDDL